MHELLTLVDACQKAGIDLPLLDHEELKAIKQRVNRWFYQQTKYGDGGDHGH